MREWFAGAGGGAVGSGGSAAIAPLCAVLNIWLPLSSKAARGEEPGPQVPPLTPDSRRSCASRCPR